MEFVLLAAACLLRKRIAASASTDAARSDENANEITFATSLAGRVDAGSPVPTETAAINPADPADDDDAFTSDASSARKRLCRSSGREKYNFSPVEMSLNVKSRKLI